MSRSARSRCAAALLSALTIGGAPAIAQDAPAKPAVTPAAPVDPRLVQLKAEALQMVQARSKQVQEIVDMLFSFQELGFQEFESQKYLTGILEKEGFKVERGVAGIPSAWTARWSYGTGKPEISLGSDVDGIPQASNKPGVGYKEPMVTGGPGHGEGHNSGQALNIVASIVVKQLMQRDKINGTLLLWPGIAEEQMAGKAFLVRAGIFKNTDVTLFTHVGSDLGVSWGASGSSALISAEFRFKGSSAHAAGQPWRGQSALDAAMLMGQGWEYRREHLRLQQRSHYVIKDGGDQPNVVPSTASIWFYFREQDYPRTMELFEMGKRVAQGAAMMTDTKLDTVVILGSGWSAHFSKPIAEAMHQNVQQVGMPVWDDKDQTLAKGIQRELGQPDFGLSSEVNKQLRGSETPQNWTGGGSDDIGDIAWNVPTVTLRYPSNIPSMPGHNWANAISMATPIAHKGALAGAKVQALTLLDILLTPKVVADAWDYFNNVQTKETKYKPFIRPSDQPPIWLNADIMARFKPQLQKFYYDPSKYKTYLEQLGIEYPTVRPAEAKPKGNN
ncbi:peptidase dimerization domain-containing protein [Gemmatimonas sp.]|jgi:aminobenzoyl-glutamate utilization protein B|uniref:peptidase dimerization domain-containing protein n=1 Tax=Gemmatimonas sp. TaxID=1962908 RepID=UPI0031CB2769|nr:amidohydrolase [Gemmatimonas sp.]